MGTHATRPAKTQVRIQLHPEEQGVINGTIGMQSFATLATIALIQSKTVSKTVYGRFMSYRDNQGGRRVSVPNSLLVQIPAVINTVDTLAPGKGVTYTRKINHTDFVNLAMFAALQNGDIKINCPVLFGLGGVR